VRHPRAKAVSHSSARRLQEFKSKRIEATIKINAIRLCQRNWYASGISDGGAPFFMASIMYRTYASREHSTVTGLAFRRKLSAEGPSSFGFFEVCLLSLRVGLRIVNWRLRCGVRTYGIRRTSRSNQQKQGLQGRSWNFEDQVANYHMDVATDRRTFRSRSGRRVGLARLTRRGRANTGMCERRGPSENTYEHRSCSRSFRIRPVRPG